MLISEDMLVNIKFPFQVMIPTCELLAKKCQEASKIIQVLVIALGSSPDLD